MTRRALLLLASAVASVLASLAVGLVLAAAPAQAAPAGVRAAPAGVRAAPAGVRAAPGASGSFVLIGTGGLTWTDVSAARTPALWSLLRDGSSAALSVRGVNTNTCPADGWLSLSAGQRAAAPDARGKPRRDTDDACPAIPTPDSGAVPGWSRYVEAADTLKFDAHLGTLGDEVAQSRQCIQAIGPGAALAGATPNGAIPRYAAYDATALTSQLAACTVTVVDVGSLRDPADLPETEPAPGGSRQEQAAAIDARIGTVLAATPAGADIVVASLSDAGRTERLRLVVAKGPGFGPGTLYSPSTRQPGLVQSADLTVTALKAAGIERPDGLGGLALRHRAADTNSEQGARERLRSLVDDDEASHEVHALVPPFFNAFVIAQLLIYAFVMLVWKRDFGSARTQARLLRIVRRVAIIAASVPASTFLANLIPWWRFPVPMLAVVASVGLFVAVITATALLGPWSRSLMGPVAVVSAATMLVLAADVMTGSRLQISSLMGLQPVVGGRFYGMGNVTFAIFAAAALMLAIAVSDYFVRRGQTRRGALAVLLIGGAAVVVDGAPFWGADGGGPPALLPGLAYFVLAILGITMTWRRAALVAAGTAGAFLLVAFLDSLRPVESQSHLGRFIQAIEDGKALDIVTRKLDQNVSILFSSWMTPLVPIALAFVIYVLARPTSWGSRSLQASFDRAPTLRPGLIALLITLTIGFVINDSGVAIPANGFAIAVPLIIAISVRTLEDESRSSAETRAARR